MIAAHFHKLIASTIAMGILLSACAAASGQTEPTKLAFKSYEDAVKQAGKSGMPLLVFGMTDT